MMKKYVLAASLGTVLLAGCQTTGGRGGLFNPVPHEPKISDPTDIVEVTKEHLKAGQGSLSRVLFSSLLDKHYKDYGKFRFYAYKGALPNAQPSGLTEIRGVWEKNCQVRNGVWKYPICFQADNKGVLFVTHSAITKYSETGVHDLDFRLFDAKDTSLATQEAMLQVAAAQFFELAPIRFADSRVEALVKMNQGVEKIEKGLLSVPTFTATMVDEGEQRVAAVGIFALLNTPNSPAIVYSYKNSRPMRVAKTSRYNSGNQECINITVQRLSNPQPSFLRALIGDDEVVQNQNTLCQDPKVEGHWVWKA